MLLPCASSARALTSTSNADSISEPAQSFDASFIISGKTARRSTDSISYTRVTDHHPLALHPPRYPHAFRNLTMREPGKESVAV